MIARRCMGLAIMLLPLLLPAPSPAGDDGFQARRLAMVERQIEDRGVSDPKVLAAMRKVPRHLFVSREAVSEAYEDRPLPIGYGQTISQPYIVAFMTEALKLTGGEKVLEIGTGSGYQAAVLAETAGRVHSIEIIPELHRSARKRLAGLGYGAIQLKETDGYYGWPDQGPFDAIIVTCAAGHIPPPLVEQLGPGGRIIIPVGQPWMVQSLVLADKDASGRVRTRSLMQVRFVPLVRERE
ncbi:MAG: protein-L-isoaspartate(D-aspartate) O-methyltransferase [Proteobacteria bacterium]|nr:protein-L-isoaspartate(D-aspartate) O-methyltransferase [Pseudomonadota bacterium]